MIAILVPVLGRAQQIGPLAANLAEVTTNPFTLVCICTPGDEEAIDAAKTHADTTILTTYPAGRADYAKKLALGFAHSEEEWFFQGATDLVFHGGWDSGALAIARRTGRLVIGTNDLGNPLVMRGQTSTHTLFHRSYIEQWGGTCDGSGLIFSQAYDHQWTDSEFIETAKRRNKFAFAKNSHVEHMHPHWGKAEEDDTYKKAHRATTRDMALFVHRRKTLLKDVHPV